MVEFRMIAPYEYTDSLNQRQIWEPYLTGRERQEFDTHLRVSLNFFLTVFYNNLLLASDILIASDKWGSNCGDQKTNAVCVFL